MSNKTLYKCLFLLSFLLISIFGFYIYRDSQSGIAGSKNIEESEGVSEVVELLFIEKGDVLSKHTYLLRETDYTVEELETLLDRLSKDCEGKCNINLFTNELAAFLYAEYTSIIKNADADTKANWENKYYLFVSDNYRVMKIDGAKKGWYSPYGHMRNDANLQRIFEEQDKGLDTVKNSLDFDITTASLKDKLSGYLTYP